MQENLRVTSYAHNRLSGQYFRSVTRDKEQCRHGRQDGLVVATEAWCNMSGEHTISWPALQSKPAFAVSTASVGKSNLGFAPTHNGVRCSHKVLMKAVDGKGGYKRARDCGGASVAFSKPHGAAVANSQPCSGAGCSSTERLAAAGCS